MDLHELLAVPYLLEAEAVEYEPDRWIVRLSYPELPGCIAESPIVEDALRDLERKRIETIVRLVREGDEPPVPRRPLVTADPLWTVRNLGLSVHITRLLGAAGARDPK